MTVPAVRAAAPRRAGAMLAAVVAALLLLAGCNGSGKPSAKATGPSCVPAASSAATATAIPPSQPAASRLPAVELPCLRGGAPLRLSALGRPMIVNLWASWCTPCRAELPAIQRYATTSGVTVIGVDTGDTTAAATSVVDDLGLTFPVLSDTGKSLLAAVGRSALPVTLFVDAEGGVRYLYNEGTALTQETLAALAAAHLGVGG